MKSDAPIVSLQSLLFDIASRGWLVNNLFQLGPSQWQANLRTDELVTDFGRGQTPTLALITAIANIETAQALLKSETLGRVDSQPATEIDLSELFAILKPAPPKMTLRFTL